MTYVLMVNGPKDESYDPPAVFGPFSSMEVALIFAEQFREANRLPIKATSDNNEEWSNAGWYFGIFELSMKIEDWGS